MRPSIIGGGWERGDKQVQPTIPFGYALAISVDLQAQIYGLKTRGIDKDGERKGREENAGGRARERGKEGGREGGVVLGGRERAVNSSSLLPLTSLFP